MCDTPFKTPLSHFSTRSNENVCPPKTSEKSSDSEESTASEGSSAYSGSSNDLTLQAMFDDLMRLIRYQRGRKLEAAFMNFVEESKLVFQKYCEALDECQRLRVLLDLKSQECSESEKRMRNARHLLDEEKKKKQRAVREKEELEEQLDQVRDLLFKDNRVKIGDEAKEKLSFLNKRSSDANNGYHGNLSCIREINSTGSMLSDWSVSQSIEDDLDTSHRVKKRKEWKHKASTGDDVDVPVKKRRSTSKVIEIGPTDTVRATTTVTVNKKGPITATSVIESIPNSDNNCVESDAPPSSDDGIGSTAPSAPPPHLVFESWARTDSPRRNTPRMDRNSNLRPDYRPHCLQQKTIIKPETCICCEKRLGFAKTALKCKECRSICHEDCKGQLPLPCIPVINTPNHKNILGIISDYTPMQSPMVPAIIVHCANEIELRGLNELGLYRISASEKEVKLLKEKFLKGKGPPSIAQIDIHVLCGCVKDFLRNLTEPLVTFGLWRDFARAVEARDRQDVAPALYQCIAELPQPNRDTLAYMILHLQRIAEAPECKMPIENLAKVFGPAIVGFSSDNPSPDDLMRETRQQIAVVDNLLRLPSEYWSSFINVSRQQPSSKLQQTPSTDSLLRPNIRYTPNSVTRSARRRRFFETPPSVKTLEKSTMIGN